MTAFELIAWPVLFILMIMATSGVFVNHKALRELHRMLNSRLDTFILEARKAADAAAQSAYTEGFHAGRVERAMDAARETLNGGNDATP